jgi:hypothetical protein
MFEEIFGFDENIDRDNEQSPYAFIHEHFIYESDQHTLQSKANERKYSCGKFEIKNKVQLQSTNANSNDEKQTNKKEKESNDTSNVKQMVVNDLEDLYVKFPDSVFQVASQFNCLEFATPYSVPEDGISDYEYDRTQGPASALICLPATVYRNFFVPMPSNTDDDDATTMGQYDVVIGQTEKNQINNLAKVEKILNNADDDYFTVENGYVDSTTPQLSRLTKRLIDEPELAQQLEDAVCVGIQTDADSVIDPDKPVSVAAQVFCSALSCGYSSVDAIDDWKPLAMIVLKAAYKCTLMHAINNSKAKRVFLTFLGGGAFKNKMDWIVEAMCEAILKMNMKVNQEKPRPDIIICHYREINPTTQEKINNLLRGC